MVGYDVSASFERVKDMQEALAVETIGAEAPEARTHVEATNVERHTSHLLAQEPSPVGSVNPNDPEPSPMPTDHTVTFPIDQAPASTAVHTMTHDVPYHEAVDIPFGATPGPAHSESAKQIPLTLSDAPDSPSMPAEAHSPAEGSANANGSTSEDWPATSGHTSFIDGGTLPRLSQWQETALLSTTKHDHVAAAHGNAEAPWPRSTTSLIPGDPKSPSTFISDSPAPLVPPCGHQHHPQIEHTEAHHHLNIQTAPICPMPCPMDDVTTDTLTKPLPLAKVKHFAASLRLHAK